MSSTLMKIAGYSSGMTPRDGYRDWFVIESITLSMPERSQRVSGRVSEIGFAVWRRLDAMTSRLIELHARGVPIRFILVDIDGGQQPMRHMRFDQVFVAAHRFPEDEKQLESVSFKAESWAMT